MTLYIVIYNFSSYVGALFFISRQKRKDWEVKRPLSCWPAVYEIELWRWQEGQKYMQFGPFLVFTASVLWCSTNIPKESQRIPFWELKYAKLLSEVGPATRSNSAFSKSRLLWQNSFAKLVASDDEPVILSLDLFQPRAASNRWRPRSFHFTQITCCRLLAALTLNSQLKLKLQKLKRNYLDTNGVQAVLRSL